MSGRNKVYFAYEIETGLTKIGTSSTPAERVSGLSCERKTTIVLTGIADAHRGRGLYVERFVHLDLADKHVHKEWFRLTEDDVRKGVVFAQNVRVPEECLWTVGLPRVPWRNLTNPKRKANTLARRASNAI